jgi:hypothetical protein
VNSFYIMTHNVGGDDKDVWPWLGKTQREAMSNGGRDARFDAAKLDEWRELFEYMQGKGVVPYLVLEDDSAWKGFDRGRYYREIGMLLVCATKYRRASSYNLKARFRIASDGIFGANSIRASISLMNRAALVASAGFLPATVTIRMFVWANWLGAV